MIRRAILVLLVLASGCAAFDSPFHVERAEVVVEHSGRVSRMAHIDLHSAAMEARIAEARK